MAAYLAAVWVIPFYLGCLVRLVRGVSLRGVGLPGRRVGCLVLVLICLAGRGGWQEGNVSVYVSVCREGFVLGVLLMGLPGGWLIPFTLVGSLPLGSFYSRY